MRMLKLTVALIAVLGWAASAHAGTVKKVYNVVFGAGGSTGKTYVYGSHGPFTFTASAITGNLKAAVFTTASTFTSHASNPPPTAWLHMQPSGKIVGKGKNVAPLWDVVGTVSIHFQGTGWCHVASHNAASDTVIPSTCNVGGVWVKTKAHCSGNCNLAKAPGCWATPPNTKYHTQKWKAKSVHCGEIRFTHTVGTAHYVRSCSAKLAPSKGHTCASGTTLPHLASSDPGYHVFHLVGKLKSTP